MPTQIFVNLPVQDLDKSMTFFSQMGYTFNPQFTNEHAACMVISENIFAMLVVTAFFKTFTNKEVSDSSSTEVIIALSADSREEVNNLVDKAFAAGAQPSKEPSDHGWMFSRSFLDLDGHIWEVFYMDMAAAQAQFEEKKS